METVEPGSSSAGVALVMALDDWEVAKEEVRERVDIVSVVREYVRLEKKGKNYWALCPFHTEDTPSFSVTPEMDIFKCFGCGKGGDVFTFMMEIEGCEFPEAMRMLADRAGVELPSGKQSEEERSRRQQFFSLNEYVAERYQEAFWSKPGEQARRYMKERGFSESLLKQFGIGYAPAGWDNLLRALKRDDRSPKQALELGLLSRSNDNVFDMFRERVMFPIHDLSERVLGFGGRAINSEDEDTPKYLNSPETPIFSKREVLYGLPFARESIRKENRCLVMEGYTDVMRCHEAGFESAVAALGTALTAQQVHQIQRYADEIVLVYDGDEAGKKAARRGGEVGLKNGLKATVVLLPAGTDPADVIAESPEKFKRLISQRRPFIRVLFNWFVEAGKLDTSAGKEQIIKNILPLVNQLPGRLQQEEEIKWLAGKLGVEEDFLFNQLTSFTRAKNRQLSEQLKDQSGQSIEEIFFRSLSQQPEKFDAVMEKISKKDFFSERSKVIMEGLVKLKNQNREFSPQNWLEQVPADFHSYLAGLLSTSEKTEFAAGIDPLEITAMVRNRSIRRERSELKRNLREQDDEKDRGTLDEAKKALLEQTIEMKRQEEDQQG